MSSKPETTDVVPSGFFGAGKSRSAAELAKSIPAIRPSKPATARSRIAAGKTKKTRVAPMAPTSERAAQGLIATPKVIDAPHRAVSLAEQLRDQRELQKPRSRLTPDELKQLHEKGKLDHDHRTSEGMYEAGLRLRRLYEGCMIGTLKAQDLNRVIGLGSSDDTVEEAWVQYRKCFKEACAIMGWFDHKPLRGNGRLVVAVICQDMTIYQAALIHTGEARKERALSVGLDRLREGLFCLAAHWRMI